MSCNYSLLLNVVWKQMFRNCPLLVLDIVTPVSLKPQFYRISLFLDHELFFLDSFLFTKPVHLKLWMLNCKGHSFLSTITLFLLFLLSQLQELPGDSCLASLHISHHPYSVDMSTCKSPKIRNELNLASQIKTVLWLQSFLCKAGLSAIGSICRYAQEFRFGNFHTQILKRILVITNETGMLLAFNPEILKDHQNPFLFC